jgi:hypothetical protein
VNLADHGPPVRLRDLCRLTGFSKMKFLDDIDRGDLTVQRIRTGHNHLIVVEREEARRYLETLGFGIEMFHAEQRQNYKNHP